MTRRRCLESPAEYPAALQLFLDFDDRLGALQSPPQMCILPLGLRQLRRQRVPYRRLGPPLGGRHRTKRSTVTLPAPVRQRRRVQTFPPQDRSEPTNAGRAVRLGQNTQLRLRCKSPTSRPIRHLGRRRRRGRHDARSSVITSPGSTVGISFLVLHDHDGCPSPSRLNFKDSDVSPSLARRVIRDSASVRLI
jgi:hypothetical protein